MNNIIILVSLNHPLYEKLTKLNYPCYTINNRSELDIIEDHKETIAFDFILGATNEKEKIISSLIKNFEVISDLTCAWGEMLCAKYSKLQGAFAASFYSPKNTIEIYLKDEKRTQLVNNLFKEIGLETKPVSSPGHGFIYPRTISMIINEAYFSIEDELASQEDIDTAMLYGVNYPLGPIDWSKKIGLTPIKLLLDDLFEVTHDKRYKLSTKLRMLENLN
jgi:3-hydroxybutyryl-CoA dehydrogenase